MSGFLQRLKFAFTGRLPHDQPAPHLRPRAKVDAAQTTDENRKHWANADALGPNASFDSSVTARVRNRARYETLNNSYLKSLVKRNSYDLIGTCPRPEFLIPGDTDGELGKAMEQRFAAWSRVNLLGRNLRLLHKCNLRDGGGFAVLDNDPDSPDPVQMTVRIVEREQCCTPPEFSADPLVFDGKRVNRVGRPVLYYFLKYHPGEYHGYTNSNSFQAVDAKYVLHWFEQDRAGQQNGIPQITPALPLFAQLRRYGQAVLTAAEVASMITGVLKSKFPPPEAGDDGPDTWDPYELVRGAFLTLPDGYEIEHTKPEQPTTQYPEYERCKLNEAGRSTGSPLNVTTGNSSGYNFSSGRLDHLPYQRDAWIDRDEFEQIVFDPIVMNWLAEAVRIDGYLPANLPPIDVIAWTTNWDGFDEIDQNKSATADDVRLRNGTTTFAAVASQRSGEKWRDVIDQIAAEIAYCEARGVRHPMAAPPEPPAPTPPEPTPQDVADGADPPEQRNGHHRIIGRYRR